MGRTSPLDGLQGLSFGHRRDHIGREPSIRKGGVPSLLINEYTEQAAPTLQAVVNGRIFGKAHEGNQLVDFLEALFRMIIQGTREDLVLVIAVQDLPRAQQEIALLVPCGVVRLVFDLLELDRVNSSGNHTFRFHRMPPLERNGAGP